MDQDEAANIRNCDVEEAVRVVEANRDCIMGIKMRASAEVLGDNGIAPLELACAAAERVGLPLMVHIGEAPPALDAILDRMRKGDILTHLYTGFPDRILSAEGKPRNRIVDGAGSVRQEVRQARGRGVLMDVGHGAGSFNFGVARAALADGFPPDTISTDLHSGSIDGPVYDMPTTMSKLLHLGMDLEAVILAATARPAQAIGREDELGTLRVGASGDVAVFELQEGSFAFHDSYDNVEQGRQRLVNRLTVCRGEVLAR
jgi:dihydroorotase